MTAAPSKSTGFNASPYTAKMRDALVKFKQGAVMRIDSWVNEATGFGTARDKTEFGFVLPSRILSDQELSALYHSDDMAARMVDIIPQEMMREGFGIETGDVKLDASINDKLDDLDAPGKLVEGMRWGRAFGGAGLLIGADDGRDADQPLVPERAKDIDYLYCIDRRLLWPMTFYEEPGHPKLGQPKTFLVTTMGGTHYSTSVVHETRLILFRGAATGIREKMMLFGWDLSVMQRAYEVLRSFNTGWRAVETLLTDGNQAIFKMTGLAEMLASGGEEVLRTRMQAMDLYRSVMRALVIDADGKESFDRHSTTFAGIPDTLDKFMLRLAAAVQIPVTILMGQSPAGMNATGESDFRWFYDRIRAEQTTMLAPKIRRLVSVWLRTKKGQSLGASRAKQLGVKFPALWTETPLVQAQRQFQIAQADDLYINNQTFSPEEVAISRAAPDGFDRNIVLTPEALKARGIVLASDIAKMSEGDVSAEAAVDESGKPIEAAAITETASLLKLTASDLASIVKVNEARASVGLPPLPGADGQMTLPQFKAKYAAEIATAANAEAGVEGTDIPAHEAKANAPPLNAPGRFDAGPRPFVLIRDEDETGISGTGEIAAGCVFADGKVAVRWKTATASTTLFDSVRDMLAVHGHSGKTRIVYDDGGS
jgi:phage-related protein (TIGR01555 family)